MSWIKSHQSLREHPKTRKLARRVGGVPTAVGVLHCLWWWALDYASDGDLSKYDAEDIAVACAWEGAPKEVVKHLTECGFLDADDGGLFIHDWWEYGEARIREIEENRRRASEAYAKNKAAKAKSNRSLCVDSAQSTPLDREIDRKKERTCARELDAAKPRTRAKSSGPVHIADISSRALKAATEKSAAKNGGAA